MVVEQQELTMSTRAAKARPSSYWHLDARTIARGKQGVQEARAALRASRARAEQRKAAAAQSDRSAA